MDLRSGQCFWPLTNGLRTYPPLEGDAACEVLIVGGGITGALAAHRLTLAGKDCILIDRRDIGWGSTLASTAMLQYEIDVSLCELSGLIGERDAARAYILCRGSLNELASIVGTLPDRCDFQRRPSLYLGTRRRHSRTLSLEADARRRIGIDVAFLDGPEVRRAFGIDAPCALLSADGAEVDPYRLSHTLLADAASRGLRIFDRTALSGYAPGRGHVVLPTERAGRIVAKRVVFATGYEAQSMLRQRIVDLHSTYALVTEPVDAALLWKDRCLIWEAKDPYFYLRTTGEGRILMGGEDLPFRTPALRDRLIPRKASILLRRFARMFPDIPAECAFAWAGTFGATRDGLAYGGATDEYPGELFALGFGGNGITFGVILARIIDDLIAGHANDDARLFRFDR